MHLNDLFFLATWATLLSGTLANFDLYHVEFERAGQSTIYHWRAFEAGGDCDTSMRTRSFEEISDVSGSKLGMRCERSGCKQYAPIRDIEQLEMHFRNDPLLHFS